MSCNVVSTYADFVSKNLNTYTKMIMSKYYDKELVYKYINTYIDVRYYNRNVSIRATLEGNLNYYLNDVYKKNNSKTSKFILELIKMFYYVDDVKKIDFNSEFSEYVRELDNIRKTKLGLNDKEFAKKFSELVLDNRKRQRKYIELFNSNDFYLEINEISSKNVVNIDINNTISIPKLYSNYAINRVWNNGLISENSLQICYYLLNQQLLKNIIDGNFNYNYIVPFKCTLFSKKDKIKRVLEIMNNDAAKDIISLKIKYSDFINYKDEVYKLMQEGYQFSVILDEKYLKSTNINILDNFRYIIINEDKYKDQKLAGHKNILMM